MKTYFKKENIYLDISGNTFEEVLKNVTLILEERNLVKSSFCNAVLERENVFPTGLEFQNYNIAIPHADSEHVNDNSIVIIKPKNTIVFKDMATNSKNLDVNVILLLLISKSEEQVGVLSGIIKKFSNEQCYKEILESTDVNSIYNIIINN